MTSGHPDDQPERVVVRDKRRVDPETGQTRVPDPDPGSGESAGEPAAETEQVPTVEARLLDERTADLQRLQAEYANYRKRVDRDRIAIGELATGAVLAALLPVLDDVDRARSHGDLSGAFKSVADQFDAVLTKLGLEPFGEPGDPFDPALHEAVMHSESDEVQVPTATTIMRRGYRLGERLLRPAMVGVTDPQAATPPPADGATTGQGTDSASEG